MKILKVSDFSMAPGGRFRKDGPYSGEEFRDDVLIPAIKSLGPNFDEELLIDLDGGFGYAASFLDEVFGKLIEKYGAKKGLLNLRFKSDEEPSLLEEIKRYILRR
jgi:hypothetical protein